MPLSFFTNSGNSYGSSIPFQRIVEPAQLGFFLNLEQAELLRVQRYNEGWRFYYGKHWIFDREDGEPLVTLNYFRKIIDKGVAFLTSKGFVIQTPTSLEEVTKPFLDEVWEYNRRDQLVTDMATMGSVSGDVFNLITYEEPSQMQKRLNPYSEGRIRVNLLGSEQVYPTWDPLNIDTLTAVRIETIYYAERGTRQLDREDRVNHEGRQLYTKRFTQIITPFQIVEQYHGDMPVIRPNILGEIPIVHIRNLSLPKEYYGLPDSQDIIDLQRELNEKATDISDTINYHSAPITVITGAKAKQLERGPRQIWSGLPAEARVQNLQLGGDLTAAVNYWERIKKCIHELSDIPEGALGAMQAISNTSGVALHMTWQPLIEKTRRKRIQYEPGIEQINYFILRIAMLKGLLNVPFDLCKHCGGRIVELSTGKTTRVWNTESKQYDEVPLRKKKCYKINNINFEFLDPSEEKLKYWRQYGFGGEIKEGTLSEIEKAVNGAPSFWDYAAKNEEEMATWKDQVGKIREANAKAQEDYATQMSEYPGEQQTDEDGNPIEQAPPAPTQQAEPPAPMHKINKLPMGEVSVPEEPEHVEIVQRLMNPETGEVAHEMKENKFLIPTGCKKCQYLSPFENKVSFNDVLPKDEALQATLYQQYQQSGWVDEDWVRERIPEIAAQATEIKKRLKAKATTGLPTQTPQGVVSPTTVPGGSITQLNPMTEEQQQSQVPGQGGNPTQQGQPGQA